MIAVSVFQLSFNGNQSDSKNDKMSPFYTNERENFWKNKMNQMEDEEYYEFEMKKLSDFVDNKSISDKLDNMPDRT